MSAKGIFDRSVKEVYVAQPIKYLGFSGVSRQVIKFGKLLLGDSKNISDGVTYIIVEQKMA
jgi:hypothetical protein